MNIPQALVELCRRSHARGWALGTSGNFSAVISRRPFRLAITASACNKRALCPADIVTVNERGEIVGERPRRDAEASRRRPSAETMLHLAIARDRGAGAIVHTHSVWSTMLSDVHAPAGGLGIGGYEMLKGLHGVTSHEHREWIPILENDQDMPRLARGLCDVLAQHENAHAVLLRRHGLYTWGDTLDDAERHLEILEFLFETLGRTGTFADRSPGHGLRP